MVSAAEGRGVTYKTPSVDLRFVLSRPAGKTSPRYMRRLAQWQEKHAPPHAEHDFTGRRVFSMQGSGQLWRGPDGNALPPDAPVANNPVVDDRGHSIIGSESGRPSIAQNSESGLVREV